MAYDHYGIYKKPLRSLSADEKNYLSMEASNAVARIVTTYQNRGGVFLKLMARMLEEEGTRLVEKHKPRKQPEPHDEESDLPDIGWR